MCKSFLFWVVPFCVASFATVAGGEGTDPTATPPAAATTTPAPATAPPAGDAGSASAPAGATTAPPATTPAVEATAPAPAPEAGAAAPAAGATAPPAVDTTVTPAASAPTTTPAPTAVPATTPAAATTTAPATTTSTVPAAATTTAPAATTSTVPAAASDSLIVVPGGGNETERLLVLVQLVGEELRVVAAQEAQCLRAARKCTDMEQQEAALEVWALKRARKVQLSKILVAARARLAEIAPVDDIVGPAVAKISKEWSGK